MLSVDVFNAHPRTHLRKPGVSRWVRAVLHGEKIRSASVSVVFIGGGKTRALNRKYLRHDASTDVLAFPLGEGETLEGEVYVNIDRARRQARDYGVPFREEIVRLVVHGTLHLAGEDDAPGAAQRRMQRKEDAYVRRLCHA